MTDVTPSKMRCLARIVALGGMAQPKDDGRYRITLGLLEQHDGTPIQGTVETRLEKLSEDVQQALVDASEIWIEFTPVDVEKPPSSSRLGTADPDAELRVLEVEDLEICWDDEETRRSECPECNGHGTIDLTVGPRRVVECERCEGTGVIEAGGAIASPGAQA
jgi:hypothetical protein